MSQIETAPASELGRYIGREAEPPRHSRYPVSEAMIVHWVEALGDRNPIYLDAEAARATGRAGVISPPAMISTWIMSGYQRYREVQRLRASRTAETTEYSRLMQELDNDGYTSVVATDIEQTYIAEVAVGARVSAHYTIEDVSPLKRTKLGEGHFVTLHKRYVDEGGTELAHERFRMLRFRPVQPASGARRSGVPPLVRTHDNNFWFEAAAEGRLLIQRCAECGALRHPPGPACPKCRSFAWDTLESTRRGTLHSWTIVHHPQDSAFTYPLAVGLVDLEEGTRLVADFETLPSEGLEIGAPVHVVFGPHEHGETLPYVRLGDLPSALPETRMDAPVDERTGGTALPPLTLNLDRTAIAAGAIASQDFEDVHHDPGRAHERGMADIFLSINTTNGLVGRYLTDWGGPDMRIHSVRLRLGVPQFAGMDLEFTGTAFRGADGQVEVDVIGRNENGVHVSARAVVSGAPSGAEQEAAA